MKKEGNSATCDNMDGPEGLILSEVSQTEKKKYRMIFICGTCKRQTNGEQNGGFQGVGVRGMGRCLLKGTNLSCKMNNFLGANVQQSDYR